MNLPNHTYKPSLLDGDCEWIAIDSTGQLGFFTSAGSLHVPGFYLEHADLHLRILKTVLHMPDVGEAIFAMAKTPGLRYQSWTDVSEKGIYGYDYDLDGDDGYKLITLPAHPVRVDGYELALAAHDIPFFHGVFGFQATTIDRNIISELKPNRGKP
jgi:hypothetical protein